MHNGRLATRSDRAARLVEPYPRACPKAMLKVFHAALALRATTPVDILCVGSSLTEGSGASAIGKRWPDLLRDQLRAKFQPAGVTGGLGYISAAHLSGVTGYPVATAGSPAQDLANYGLGLRSLTLNSTGKTATLTFTGTGFDVFYVSNAGQFNVIVDGGAPALVTATSGTADGRRHQVTGLAATSHTVEVAWVAGTVNLEGWMAYNGDEAAGIRIWEGGHSGATSSVFAVSTWLGLLATIQPDLVVIEIGVNDFYNGSSQVTPGTFQSNLRTLIANVRANVTIPPSIVLVPTHKRAAVGGLAQGWNSYVDVIYSLGQRYGYPVFDIGQRFGTGNTLSLLNVDLIHPTDKGYQLWADALTSVVSP